MSDDTKSDSSAPNEEGRDLTSGIVLVVVVALVALVALAVINGRRRLASPADENSGAGA